MVAMQEWRKHLWQPRAFCWRGANYLEKMASDTQFLCSPVGKSLLASVGLDAGDMVSYTGWGQGQCVHHKCCEKQGKVEKVSTVERQQTGPSLSSNKFAHLGFEMSVPLATIETHHGNTDTAHAIPKRRAANKTE